MMEVVEDREVWRLNLELLPPHPHGKAGDEERVRERVNIRVSIRALTVNGNRFQ